MNPELLDELETELKRIAAINTKEDRERVVPELTVFMWLQKARAALPSSPVAPTWFCKGCPETFTDSRIAADHSRATYHCITSNRLERVFIDANELLPASSPVADTRQRYESAALDVVKAIRRDYLPDMGSNDGGQMLVWLLDLCETVAADFTTERKGEP